MGSTRYGMNLIQKILNKITGKVQVTRSVKPPIVWPDDILHWDGKDDTLDDFLQRRIDAGYPTGHKKEY